MYCPPPPPKRAKEVGYSRPTLPAQATSSTQAPDHRAVAQPDVPVRKLKRDWTAAHMMASPSAPTPQTRDIAAPPTQGQEVALQHAMPGPLGTQLHPGYKNVSIFS